jgi:membrane protein DedA with SNARE-associated domain
MGRSEARPSRSLDGEPGLADDLILQFGYFGIFLVLVLGGLGLPVPEEAPIIVAAILARKGTMHWIPALGSCFAGVLVGDFVVYFLGFFYGEKVLSFPLTRKFLTRAREAQIKGYFHRHGVKILILGRFAVGFRTAAYLTAGILRLPTLKLFLTDLCAASFSTLLMFGLGYAFATKVEEGFNEAKQYITPAIALGLAGWLLHRYIKARMRAGERVGPPVLLNEDDAPLPPDDLHSTVVRLAADPVKGPDHGPSTTPEEPGSRQAPDMGIVSEPSPMPGPSPSLLHDQRS